MTIANVPARPRAATMRAVTTARGGAGQSASAATMRAVTRAWSWGRNPRRAAARGEPGYLLAIPAVEGTLQTGARYGRQISTRKRLPVVRGLETEWVPSGKRAERPGRATPQRPVRSSA